MVPRCESAAEGFRADMMDLRTLQPWDKEIVLDSVRHTRRCLIVPEDLRTGGFGAEIAASSPTKRSSTSTAGRAGDHARHPEPTSSKLMERALPATSFAPRSSGWWVLS